jgi:hypothetical protein
MRSGIFPSGSQTLWSENDEKCLNVCSPGKLRIYLETLLWDDERRSEETVLQ